MAKFKPGVEKVPHQDAGSFVAGFAPRLVWHTTEVLALPNYGASAPHFTINPKTGKTWQHVSCDRAARALLGSNIAGIATNQARAIQVEIIGFAGESDTWPASYYGHLRELAAWIEDNCGVASTETVDFLDRNHPMSHGQWRGYKGHCGHQHVPGQTHWDPGEFRVALVMGNAKVHRNLTIGDEGPDVAALQRAINKRARGCCRPDHVVLVDGVYRAETKKHGAFVGFILGLGTKQAELVAGGMSEIVQSRIRDPAQRNETQRTRAAERREQHCHCTHEH